MKKCKLCKNNEADKKGSHIVPHFLLKRIENIDNKTGRDYEIGYKIGRLLSKSHFGRAVQPEKLAETFGEITDKDIDENLHPLVVDNFLCTECEQSFAVIESSYAATIKNVYVGKYESGISTTEGILFWAGVFWRMSVHGESGVQLSQEQNETLRKLLDHFLPCKGVEVDEKTFCEDSIGVKISYKILRCHNCHSQKAKWLLFHPEFYNCLCLFIDEFVVVMSLDSKYDELQDKDCFGINEIIKNATVNKAGHQEVVESFDESIFVTYSSKIVDRLRDEYIDGLNYFLDELQGILVGPGEKMPEIIKKEILMDMASENNKIGRRYTKDEIVKSTYKVLKKYGY